MMNREWKLQDSGIRYGANRIRSSTAAWLGMLVAPDRGAGAGYRASHSGLGSKEGGKGKANLRRWASFHRNRADRHDAGERMTCNHSYKPNVWVSLLLLCCVAGAMMQEAQAVPAFARKHDLQCTSCHVLPPKLNARGEAFRARGYRLPEEVVAALREQTPLEALAARAGASESPSTEKAQAGSEATVPKAATNSRTVPLSAWITSRYEHPIGKFQKNFPNRVEIISAAPIGKSMSYFVEWRPLSFETRGDGTLRDRSGRFEDLLLNADLNKRSSLTLGQYRSLRQVDVSLRLSLAEPAVFSTSLPGKPDPDARTQSLRGFSPSGRSPGLTYQYQSIVKERAGDGLFHAVTVPFPGEISLPLTREARNEASFELDGSPKGVFLETFYRRRLNSLGMHAFLDDDRRLVQGVGTMNRGKFYTTAVLGFEDLATKKTRMRYSLEGEYLLTPSSSLRTVLGLRHEQITNASRRPASIAYLALSGPNTRLTFPLTLQYRRQRNNNAFSVEFGSMF
ncbi:MAG: hypothetical protein KY445_04065 [Armatimonadetes bacterium]|nr:hypothetical protein [Armatimonadota bacterium]